LGRAENSISEHLNIKVLWVSMPPDIPRAGLEITPVRSSRTSTFSARASNVVFLLAPQARAQASHSPTKFLIMILRRKDKF